jgi:hypothetical protein
MCNFSLSATGSLLILQVIIQHLNLVADSIHLSGVYMNWELSVVKSSFMSFSHIILIIDHMNIRINILEFIAMNIPNILLK